MPEHKSPSKRHVDDLMEVLGELLTVPELLCFEPDEMFDHTHEVIAKAHVVRAAIRDELADHDASCEAWMQDTLR